MTRTTNYKDIMQELQDLLTDMQAEDVDVDTAIRKYERGQQLISMLQGHLDTAENKIHKHKILNNKKDN